MKNSKQEMTHWKKTSPIEHEITKKHTFQQIVSENA